MTAPQKSTELSPDDTVIVEMRAEKEWTSFMSIRLVLLVAAAIIVVSILDGNLGRAVIRGLILLVAALVIYSKSDAIFYLGVLIHRNGRIVVRRGRRRKVVQRGFDSAIQIVKTKKNWLIGVNKVKVPIRAFPDLERQVREIPA
jgi:hypothetical protein